MKALTFDNSIDRATKLNNQHFGQMLGLAFVFHVFVALIWSLMPNQETLQVPVHVINIKLGSAEDISSPTLLAAAPAELAASAPAAGKSALPEPEPYALKESPITPEPQKKPPVPQVTNDSMANSVPVANGRTKGDVKLEKGKSINKGVQYVREGSVYGNSTDPKAEILSRYEQQISSWIQKFKFTPKEARGMEGEAVVRLRINRQGQILYAVLERSTGQELLDKAVSDMIKSANPVPAVPADYPPGNLLEFLVPISFKVE